VLDDLSEISLFVVLSD